MPKLSKQQAADDEAIKLGAVAIAYLSKKKDIDSLTKEIKELRTVLEEALEAKGKKDPNTGHVILNVEFGGQEVEVKHERRVSASLSPEAENLLRANLDKKVLKDLIETVPVIREDILKVYIMNETVPNDLALRLYTETENYAFKVKKL